MSGLPWLAPFSAARPSDARHPPPPLLPPMCAGGRASPGTPPAVSSTPPCPASGKWQQAAQRLHALGPSLGPSLCQCTRCTLHPWERGAHFQCQRGRLRSSCREARQPPHRSLRLLCALSCLLAVRAWRTMPTRARLTLGGLCRGAGVHNTRAGVAPQLCCCRRQHAQVAEDTVVRA